MICERCQEPIEAFVTFKCTDGNVPIGARQRYSVIMPLCPKCAMGYAISQIPNKIYMVNMESLC